MSSAASVVSQPARSWRAIVAILLVALVAHGLIALNGGVFWDDWLLIDALRNDHASAVWNLAANRGIPTDAFIWWGVAGLPHMVIGYKIVVVILLALSGLLARWCALEYGLSPRESLIVACLAVAYPGCEAWVVLSITQYLVYYVVFLAAVWTAFRASTAPRWPWTFRIVAAVLFYLSFGLNSLLVWSPAVCVLLFLRERRRLPAAERPGNPGSVAGAVFRVGYPFGAAVLYWIVKQMFFRPTGLYAGYNAIHLVSWAIVRSPLLFVLNGIIMPVADSLATLFRYPVVLLLAMAGAWIAFRAARVSASRVAGSWAPLVAAGVVGLALAVVPYSVVGLAPERHGWSTRHNLLLGLPLAVLIVGLMRAAAARGATAVRISTAAVVVLIIAFAARSAAVDLGWLGRWAATRSITLNLPVTARMASVVWIDDRIDGPTEEPYRFYEWASILEQFDGVDRHLGVDLREASPGFIGDHARYFVSAYNLGHFDPAGCHTAIQIAPGAAWTNPAGNGATYLRDMMTAPQREQTFLEHLVRITDIIPPRFAGHACGAPDVHA